MVRAFLLKAVLLLVLTLVLAAPIQAADSKPAGKLPTDSQGILAQVWHFLTMSWARIGCGIDPEGLCVPRPDPAGGIDSGCDIDPSGRCVPRPNPTIDSGCGIDPSGGCGH